MNIKKREEGHRKFNSLLNLNDDSVNDEFKAKRFCFSTSNKTIIKHDGEDVFLCVKRIRKKPIKLIKIQSRTEFAVSKGIISDSMRDRICNLYDTRNNVHILKATQNKYVPNLSDAKKAYALMDDFVDEIKLYISSHN